MKTPSEKGRKKERLYTNPSVLILCFNSFVVALGFGLVQPMLAFYILALEGAITEPPSSEYMVSDASLAEFAIMLGLMTSSFMASRTLLSRYFGELSDKKGRTPIIVLGLVCYSVFFLLFGLGRNTTDLLIMRLGLGVASAAVWPTGQAMMIDVVGESRRGEGMGLYVFTMQIGWFSGPGIGGFLYNFCRDVLNLSVPLVFRIPYIIAGLVVLPAPILSYIYLKESKKPKSPKPMLLSESQVTKEQPNQIEVYQTKIQEQMDKKTKRQIRALYILFISNGLSMGLANPLFQLYLMARITSDVATIGLLISGAGMIGIMMNIPAGILSDRYGRKSLTLWSGVATRGSMAILPFTKGIPDATMVYILRSGTWAIHQPVLRAIQGDITPPLIRGKIFGTLQAFFNLGATIGPIVGGWLFAELSLKTWDVGRYTIDGIGAPFWLAAVTGVIGLLIFALYIKEPKTSTN